MSVASHTNAHCMSRSGAKSDGCETITKKYVELCLNKKQRKHFASQLSRTSNFEEGIKNKEKEKMVKYLDKLNTQGDTFVRKLHTQWRNHQDKLEENGEQIMQKIQERIEQERQTSTTVRDSYQDTP